MIASVMTVPECSALVPLGLFTFAIVSPPRTASGTSPAWHGVNHHQGAFAGAGVDFDGHPLDGGAGLVVSEVHQPPVLDGGGSDGAGWRKISPAWSTTWPT